MSDTIQATKRETRGKRNARRLRADGKVPAILYGHGKESISLAVNSAELAATVRHGGRLVELSGDVQETALLREIQWDTFGVDILHIDFTRISADERITVTAPVETRGVSPGTQAGGVVELLMHSIELEGLATAIPDKLQININNLQLGDVLTASAIDVGENVKMLVEPDAVIVQCVERREEDEEGEAMVVEPEVIGRKPTDEDEGGA